MMKCTNPDHPFCTQWVMPGASVCAAQHIQPRLHAESLAPAPAPAPARQMALDKASHTLTPNKTSTKTSTKTNTRIETAMPYLHFSGFDPRAAGGRQTLKIELLGMAAELGTQLELSIHSELLNNGHAEHVFVRTTRGHWRPILLEFSSRNREHGQYRLDMTLKYMFGGQISRQWVCTPVLLVPRKDASLDDIQRIFLSRHKNVKINVDDASIAKISGYQNADQLDIQASNASIAQIDFSAPKGKIDIGFTSIAWDEDLYEIDLQQTSSMHPELATSATLCNHLALPQQFQLFALDQILIGRRDPHGGLANILLQHRKMQNETLLTANSSETGVALDLTRRISARHAVIRLIDQHFEIEDISRYGVLIDGKWPGKGKSLILKTGMQLDFTASFKGIAKLQVIATSRHALVLQSQDLNECFYCLVPEMGVSTVPAQWPHNLPLLYHQHGGFWHWDQDSHKATALGTASSLSGLQGFAAPYQFRHDNGLAPELPGLPMVSPMASPTISPIASSLPSPIAASTPSPGRSANPG